MSDFHLLDKAISFATEAHAGQVRKGSGIPYILHPLEAAAICATFTLDQEVLAAAVLHDVIEDAGVTAEQIEREFGPRVARIVSGESEDKREGRPPDETWKARKRETVERMKSASWEEAAVCLGDKLSNARAMSRDYAQIGDALWGRFNQPDPAEHAWYYRSIAKALEPRLGKTAAWRELAALVEGLFPAAGA